jgi:anti-sigma28 factor (negative regulator of flagellin synthesis)
MGKRYRVVVEELEEDSKAIVARKIIKSINVKRPQSIDDIGFRHKDQIEILQKIQDELIKIQGNLITPPNVCPNCGRKVNKNGTYKSNFHSVFTDHKISLQCCICSSEDCGWNDSPTILSMFGTTSHPDLTKIQAQLGATHSYKESEIELAKQSCGYRKINNHKRIREVTDLVGELLTEEQISDEHNLCNIKGDAAELIVQVDGGHIKNKEPEKRSFEAIIATIYKPENVIEIDKNHNSITNKNVIASAMQDNLDNMETLMLSAALQQGLSSKTKITGLSDGANNCWNLIKSLEKHCGEIEYILDWFHIGKKFQNTLSAVIGEDKEELEHIKWKVWHGKATDAIIRLNKLIDKYSMDQKTINKLCDLKDYLSENLSKMVNYQNRKANALAYTTNAVESNVETLINTRLKKQQKMQWTREGANNVLQIRASISSGNWEMDWENIKLKIIDKRA